MERTQGQLTPEQLKKRNEKIKRFFLETRKYNDNIVDATLKDEIIGRIFEGMDLLAIACELEIPRNMIYSWAKIDADLATSLLIEKQKDERLWLSHLKEQSAQGKTEASKFCIKALHKYRDMDDVKESKEINITLSKEQAALLDE